MKNLIIAYRFLFLIIFFSSCTTQKSNDEIIGNLNNMAREAVSRVVKLQKEMKEAQTKADMTAYSAAEKEIVKVRQSTVKEMNKEIASHIEGINIPFEQHIGSDLLDVKWIKVAAAAWENEAVPYLKLNAEFVAHTSIKTVTLSCDLVDNQNVKLQAAKFYFTAPSKRVSGHTQPKRTMDKNERGILVGDVSFAKINHFAKIVIK